MWPFSPKKKLRFQIYDPYADMSRPERTGMIYSKEELDYGTPNMSRSENVTLIGSNSSSKETLVVKLKWRPLRDVCNTVTLVSRLYFSTPDEKCYESEEIETYDLEKTLVHSIESGDSRRILQFGSRASKLRLYIANPYRRLRLVFIGQVRDKKDNSTAFLRLTCVIVPTAKIFDFLDQYDEQCARQMYDLKKDPKPLRTFDDTVHKLLSHDRHEQKIRMSGEYLLILDNDNKDKIRKDLSLWGFHCRHFISSTNREIKSIRTKRIYAYMNNGQAYSIGNNKLDSDDIDFGYTSFLNYPMTYPIGKPFLGIDWHGQINEKLEKFELQVTSQQHQTFTSKTKVKRSFNLKPKQDNFLWFEIDTNENPGYAFVSLDDELIETQEELEAIERSRDALELALEAGEMASCEQLASSNGDPNNATQTELVLSLSEEKCLLSELVGSKASSLAHLVKLQELVEHKRNLVKFKVPFGFATTKQAYDLLLSENEELLTRIKNLEQQIGDGHLKDLAKHCEELVAFVEQIKLPDNLCQQLKSKMSSHYNETSASVKFAVRSSSWGEDEEDMSAAGQLKTILNVEQDIESLSKAIMSCFASKFSPENIEYKRQHGLPLNLPMSVVIQEMVQCDKAGVMFTCDPTVGDPRVTIITANYGLGETVVSAQADPDSIRVRTQLSHLSALDHNCSFEMKVEQIIIGKKNVVISDGGNQDNLDKSKCCLTDEEIINLAKCAQQVRQYFWLQQRDIEWGIMSSDGNPAIYLFQSRPVTGLETMTTEEFYYEGARPSQAELGFFTRANIGEVMPYPITPLSLTCYDYSWLVMGARLFKVIGHTFDNYVPHCANDIYYERYHVYFNLRSSMILSIGNRSPITRSMEIGFFGREMEPQPELIRASRDFLPAPQFFEGFRFEWEFKSMLWAPLRECNKQRAYIMLERNGIRRGKHIKSPRGDPKRLVELYQQIGLCFNCQDRAWYNHIVNITAASKQNLKLTIFLSKFIQDPMQLTAATNKFLAISPDVISAEIPQRIKQMAKLIESKGQEELERFVSLSDSDALKYCTEANESSNKELVKTFAEFLDRFGHRCYNEFELGALSWGEDPLKIVSMIKINCSSKLASKKVALENGAPNESEQNKDLDEANKSKRAKTIDDVIESLSELKQMTLNERIRLKYFLAPKSQLLLSAREQTKDILVMHADMERECVRKLAEELRHQLRIPDLDLINYLFYDELQQVVHDHKPALIMAAIRRRQMFKREFGGTLWKYDEIFSDLTPNHLKKNKKEMDQALADAPKLQGTPASSGRIQGKICLVDGYEQLNKVQPGTILLTHSTDIAFSPIFPLILGIITEVGGLISHGAVVAREYGLPSVIGIPNVTKILQDGEEIILDADNGTIIRLSKRQQDD